MLEIIFNVGMLQPQSMQNIANEVAIFSNDLAATLHIAINVKSRTRFLF